VRVVRTRWGRGMAERARGAAERRRAPVAGSAGRGGAEIVVEREAGAEDGNAVVEFLGVALLLMVPLVYLILTLGQIQAAAFAAEGAAREAGRIVVRADSLSEGAARAGAAVELAFSDQGIEVSADDALLFSCELDPCLSPGGRIVVHVAMAVGLPGIPAFVRGVVPAEVPVSAEYVAVVDEFRAVEP
jgi:hypothetical protein